MKSVSVPWLLLMIALEESNWLKAMAKSKRQPVNTFWEKIKERSKSQFGIIFYLGQISNLKFWPLKSENDFFCETLIQHGDQLTHILQKQLIDQLGDDYTPCLRDSTPLFNENMKKITLPEYFTNLPNNSWLLIAMTHEYSRGPKVDRYEYALVWLNFVKPVNLWPAKCTKGYKNFEKWPMTVII